MALEITSLLVTLSQFGFKQSVITLDDKSELALLEVARMLPQRRLVCRATWQGKSVYVKLFVGKEAAKYAARDADGIAILEVEGIATPKLLYKGSCAMADGSLAQVIVLEEIKLSKTADEVWPILTPKAQFELATKLVETVAQHHQNEIVHTDLHLKNFLISKQTIYTLDGDGVRQYGDLFYKQALKNLAELISKFDVLEQAAWLPKLLESYKKLCTWHLPMEVAQVAPLANWYRLKNARDYADKKVFRTCTDVKVAALRGLFHAVSSAYKNIALPINIADLDALITPQSAIKNGNTCTVAAALLGDTKIVIKRYNIKNFWHGISRALRPTRAAKSWTNAHRLKLLNIATANPVALIESRPFGLRGKAYFLAEYMDAPDAAEFFNITRDKTERAAAIKNIATLFYQLYLLQISHGDTKASNIKMLNNQPVLIDLDSMCQHSQVGRGLQAHVRDVRRFMQNWKTEPALYNAFIKTFRVVYQDQSPLDMADFQNI